MKREKVLETILVLVLALGVVYWLNRKPYVLVIAGILGFIGLFIPFLAEKIHWVWMKLSQAMGYVMSKVLLTIIFCIFLVPLSFFSKLFGKKTGVRMHKGSASYFVDRNFVYTKESMENVW
jgi:hypothetical protein